MDLEGHQENERGCTCVDCVDELAITTELVHEAMALLHGWDMPIGSTDAAYVETVARQADVDFDDAEGIVHEAARMRPPGSAERNCSPRYH